MSQLSYIEAGSYLRGAGFGGGQGGKASSLANVTELATALAIGKAESGLKTDAKNHNTNGTWDYGFMQINTVHGVTESEMKNPDACATAAWKIYTGAGKHFTPWVTYKRGLHLPYMPAAMAAAEELVKVHGSPTDIVTHPTDTSLTSPLGDPLKGIDAVGAFFNSVYDFFFNKNGGLRIVYVILGTAFLFFALRIFITELGGSSPGVPHPSYTGLKAGSFKRS